MIAVDIKTDVKAVERMFSNLKRGAVKRAASRAINDSLVTVRADGARLIKQAHPPLTIGAIKENIATHRATSGNLTGSVETKGRPLSLTLFRPAGGQRSIRRTKGARGQVSIRRGSTARPVTAIMGTKRAVVSYHGRKAFRVLQYGNEIFVRANANGRKLKRFRGPSLPGVFRAQRQRFRDIALRRWAVTFPNRMKYEIEKAKA